MSTRSTTTTTTKVSERELNAFALTCTLSLSLSLSLSLQERALPLARSPVITNHVESVELEIEQQLNIGDEEEERFFDLKMLDFENEIKDLD